MEAAFPLLVMITVELNGEPYSVEEATRVSALLEKLALRASRVAVEINHNVVPKLRYDQTVLREGDHVEIINFVGGG